MTTYALLLLAFLSVGSAVAQTSGQTPPPASSASAADLQAEAAQADALREKQNFVAALPLYEDLHARAPKNPNYTERLAVCLLGNAAQQPASEAAATRERARQLLLGLQAAGYHDNMMAILLENLNSRVAAGPAAPPEPGQEWVDKGEKAFTSGDLPGAIAAYSKALEINPKLYAAALFAGDAEYKQGHTAEAGTWFARAISINPNTETAYRYWGDTLEKAGNHQHAEQEFIAAIVAQPYVRASRIGLMQWASRNGMRVVPPPIKLPQPAKTEVTPASDGRAGNVNVTLPASSADKNNPDAALDLAYQMQGTLWRSTTFHMTFPAEHGYRHSLPEVASSVRAMLAVAAAQNIPEDKLSASVKLLRELEQKGMLECWIVLDGADAGIAQDYAAFRETHRELLARYIAEYDLHAVSPALAG